MINSPRRWRHTPLSLARLMGLWLVCLLIYPLNSPAGSASLYREELPDPLSDDGWTLQLDKNAMQIYTRDWPGSDFVAIKAVQTIAAPLAQIVGHYSDVAAFPEWVKDMDEARAITSFSADRRRLVYMRMNMPWPLHDRDIVAGQHFTQNPETKVVHIREWHEGDALPRVEDVVRVPKTNMELLLVPKGPHHTQFIFQGHNEPGGHIPAFLVNWMVEDIFYTSMRNMRERFESGEPIDDAQWVENFSP